MTTADTQSSDNWFTTTKLTLQENLRECALSRKEKTITWKKKLYERKKISLVTANI